MLNRAFPPLIFCPSFLILFGLLLGSTHGNAILLKQVEYRLDGVWHRVPCSYEFNDVGSIRLSFDNPPSGRREVLFLQLDPELIPNVGKILKNEDTSQIYYVSEFGVNPFYIVGTADEIRFHVSQTSAGPRIYQVTLIFSGQRYGINHIKGRSSLIPLPTEVEYSLLRTSPGPHRFSIHREGELPPSVPMEFRGWKVNLGLTKITIPLRKIRDHNVSTAWYVREDQLLKAIELAKDGNRSELSVFQLESHALEIPHSKEIVDGWLDRLAYNSAHPLVLNVSGETPKDCRKLIISSDPDVRLGNLLPGFKVGSIKFDESAFEDIGAFLSDQVSRF